MSNKNPKRNEIWKLKKDNSYLVTVKYSFLGFVIFERDIGMMFDNPRARLRKKRFLEHFEWEGILVNE